MPEKIFAKLIGGDYISQVYPKYAQKSKLYLNIYFQGIMCVATYKSPWTAVFVTIC